MTRRPACSTSGTVEASSMAAHCAWVVIPCRYRGTGMACSPSATVTSGAVWPGSVVWRQTGDGDGQVGVRVEVVAGGLEVGPRELLRKAAALGLGRRQGPHGEGARMGESGALGTRVSGSGFHLPGDGVLGPVADGAIAIRRQCQRGGDRGAGRVVGIEGDGDLRPAEPVLLRGARPCTGHRFLAGPLTRSPVEPGDLQARRDGALHGDPVGGARTVVAEVGDEVDLPSRMDHPVTAGDDPHLSPVGCRHDAPFILRGEMFAGVPG